jgi:hypothetical protein
LKFFLTSGNEKLWSQVQELAATKTSAGEQKLREYVLEAQRLSSTQRNLRICKQATVVEGHKYSPGEPVVCLLGPACMDASAVENPEKFIPGRPRTAYMHFGYGPHECLGREVALTFVVSMVKVCAGLKNLRRAPGPMGLCKYITVGKERCYLNDSWSYLTFDPTTWKLHFDGRGRGTYSPPKRLYNPEYDLDTIKRDIVRMHKRRKQIVGKVAAEVKEIVGGGSSSKAGSGSKQNAAGSDSHVDQTSAWTYGFNGGESSSSDDQHRSVRTEYSFEKVDGHTSVETVETFQDSVEVEELEAVSTDGGPWQIRSKKR